MGECEARTQGAFVAGGYGRNRGRRIAPTSAARRLRASFRSGFVRLLGGRHRPAVGDPVAVIPAEAPRRVLGERVAVALPVGGAEEGGDHLEIPLAHAAGLAPEIGEPQVDVQLQQVYPGRSLGHGLKVAR
jgi:hypothetical protein